MAYISRYNAGIHSGESREDDHYNRQSAEAFALLKSTQVSCNVYSLHIDREENEIGYRKWRNGKLIETKGSYL